MLELVCDVPELHAIRWGSKSMVSTKISKFNLETFLNFLLKVKFYMNTAEAFYGKYR